MPVKRSFHQDIATKFAEHPDYITNMVYCVEFDTFYMYRDGWYEQYTQDKMVQVVYQFVRANHGHQAITKAMVEDITQQIKWTCYRRVEETDKFHIAFKDKILNLSSFEFRDFNKEIIITHHLPFFVSDLQMPTPNFEHFLQTSLVKELDTSQPDPDLIVLIQEMFGYFLIENMKAGVAFFLVGDGANGKSVMTNLIQSMVGEEYCSAMSIQTLTTDKFAIKHLIGKKLNVSSEEESKYIKSDKFKALITGEMVSAEHKFGNSFEFKPRTKYLFASNALPTFEGLNYGLKRRLKIIPFHRIFGPSERDYDLPEKLLKELPGIVAWSVEGAKRLVRRNYTFTEAIQAENALAEFEEETSSAIRFVRENYKIDDETQISNEELYEHYRAWCEKVGKRPLNMYNFHKDLKIISKIKTTSTWNGGKTQRVKNLKKITDDDELDADKVFDRIAAEGSVRQQSDH